MATPIEIKQGRYDLTDYLIHFTRKNNSLSAFENLKSIVTDGYIKSGWSQRSMRKTVFGSKPAVCFTETPLNGFLHYVRKRNYTDAIDHYGLFFKKQDLFNAGGRSVIYGTTLPPKEMQRDDNWYVEGLPDEEQYRYILTSINAKNDWMHEREWRWANWNNYSLVDGLPVWKIGQQDPFPNTNFRFGIIGIIVKASYQKDMLENILVSNFISERGRPRKDENDFFDIQYSQEAIKSTIIIVLDEIDADILANARIEEIITSEKFHRIHHSLCKKYNTDFL